LHSVEKNLPAHIKTPDQGVNMEDEAHPQTPALSALPPDVLRHVARHLGPATIGRASCTCHALSAALNTDEVWGEILVGLGGPRRASEPRRAARELHTLESTRWSSDWLSHVPGATEEQIATQYKKHDVTIHSSNLEIHSVISSAPEARDHYVAVSCAQGRTVVVFGGIDSKSAGIYGQHYTVHKDTWALDVETGTWWPGPTGAGQDCPEARFFNADAAGGRVMKDGGGQEWLCIVGGKRFVGGGGFRDNETWLLGPLGPACHADRWRWREVQPDGQVQSVSRPKPRFHHTLTSVDLGDRNLSDPCRGSHLIILGGHDHTISAIACMWILSLNHVVLGRTPDADQPLGAVTETDLVRWRLAPTKFRFRSHGEDLLDESNDESLRAAAPGGPTAPRAGHAACEWRTVGHGGQKGGLLVMGGLPEHLFGRANAMPANGLEGECKCATQKFCLRLLLE